MVNNTLIEVEIGEPLTYDFRKDDASVLYCNIIRPNGKPYDNIFTGNCLLNLNKVTRADFGDWNIKIGFQNIIMEFLFIFSLTIKGIYIMFLDYIILLTHLVLDMETLVISGVNLHILCQEFFKLIIFY